ncbi:twin-arginine translocase TatA/TatE family subunit [Streptomyces sp. NPDC088752]|uniref:twin-arginine translocase TatA/TatE family subunit n=1 Tax=Streptomyces sp. NPDC088752 TaxID=3154963 RepID=UPI00343F38A3
MFGISETAILLVVVILLLGAKKLPELARSLGKSARILKSETAAMKAEPAPSATGGPSATEGPTVLTGIVHPAPRDTARPSAGPAGPANPSGPDAPRA